MIIFLLISINSYCSEEDQIEFYELTSGQCILSLCIYNIYQILEAVGSYWLVPNFEYGEIYQFFSNLVGYKWKLRMKKSPHRLKCVELN